jgi:hypothetical protein
MNIAKSTAITILAISLGVSVAAATIIYLKK